MVKLRETVRIHRRIAEIGRAEWEAVAGAYDNPFVSYDFLHACEASGCAVEATGWAPSHLSVADETGAVAGVAPLYLKSHSQGEYVFDHGWARAYEQAGGRYYPKLLCASPFTPVAGPRLLLRPDVDLAAGEDLLLSGMIALCDQSRASSIHITFPEARQARRLQEAGMMLRQDLQYWWSNEDYATFDDFLAALSSSRRKAIRRERREASSGLNIEAVAGQDLTESDWDAFFAFYLDTGSRKWGRPYLNRRFFSLIGETMADRIVLVMARRDGVAVAGALNFVQAGVLYGRQWGALETIPFLHFELCYYQAIELAIARGLSRVEAGAQGEHKLARGYLPQPVYSTHLILDRALAEPVERYLEAERKAVETERLALTEERSPYRSPD